MKLRGRRVIIWLLLQPPSGGCVLKLARTYPTQALLYPAAFRRLCVETLAKKSRRELREPAAFRRLCVETIWTTRGLPSLGQPPSGGCVLKQEINAYRTSTGLPAAFRRLCVETETVGLSWQRFHQPPSGGCVLKLGKDRDREEAKLPAAFRRLCVETSNQNNAPSALKASRLQAAVC